MSIHKILNLLHLFLGIPPYIINYARTIGLVSIIKHFSLANNSCRIRLIANLFYEGKWILTLHIKNIPLNTILLCITCIFHLLNNCFEIIRWKELRRNVLYLIRIYLKIVKQGLLSMMIWKDHCWKIILQSIKGSTQGLGFHIHFPFIIKIIILAKLFSNFLKANHIFLYLFRKNCILRFYLSLKNKKTWRKKYVLW